MQKNWLIIGEVMKKQFKQGVGYISSRLGMFPGKHRLIRQFDRLLGVSGSEISANRRGIVWELDTQEWIQFCLFWDGQYGANTNAFLSNAIAQRHPQGEGVVLWDVGANIGSVCLPLLSRFDRLTVDAFEPAPGPLRKLVGHRELNPAVKTRLSIHSLALSDMKGEQAFYQSAQRENQGIGSLAAMGDTEPQAIKVICALGDELIMNRIVAPPHLVKIDVEGCELKVLAGLKETLQKIHPVVVAEHSLYRLQQAGIGRYEVRDFMRSIGYTQIGTIQAQGHVRNLSEGDLEHSCDLVFQC